MSVREKGNLPAMTPKSAVELISDSKLYQEADSVESIDQRIPTASYCCALGPSSCGKTTILRIIFGHELRALSGASPFGSSRAGMSVWSSLCICAFATAPSGAFSRCHRFNGLASRLRICRSNINKMYAIAFVANLSGICREIAEIQYY